MKFVPLHVYSGYSLHKSGLKIDEYVLKCKKIGYEYAGLSDYSVLSGAPVLVHLAKEQGIKPIIGEDFLIDNLLVSFYVKNEVGYSNLLKISNKYQQKSLRFNFVRENNEGLTVVLTIQNDPLKRSFLEDSKEFAKKLAKLSRGIEDFYLGIDGVNEPMYLSDIREFAFTHGYKTVAFPFVKYIEKGDALTLKMVECIDTKNTLDYRSLEGDEYLLTPEDVDRIFLQEEIQETMNIALKAANFNFIMSRGQMIKFKNDEGLSSDDYLAKLAFEGLNKFKKTSKVYMDRLRYELGVIKKMGYSDYFLIVKDYVDFAKRNSIPVGPGRGSASGSLVSYALGITVPDPIQHNLLFERFLNIARQTMPDIDVDFSDIDRDKIVEYIATKYGRDHVANILAVQTMGAKQSLRDVGRIFNYEKHEIDLFTRLIDDEKDEKLSLREIYKTNANFKYLVQNDPYYLEIVKLAKRIEGLPRQTSLHAVGIVLNAHPLSDSLPLSLVDNGVYVEQFEKDYIEEQGFLKMDILALRNLTIIQDCLNRLKLRGIDLSMDEIPYDDKEAIKLIASGRTMGIFQLESRGMRNSIKELQPSSFEDIVALLALFRPGPMQNIPLFAKRKHGQSKITYISPVLKDILEYTYGIIVYQEQIMEIASKMAGFSLGEADTFRRAISKKDSKKLAALQTNFVKGAIKKGYSETEATNVFKLIYKFANYGFNRSHSVVYAIFSLRMAYLKAHYPEEFYASILSNVGTDKASTTFSEMKSMGIKLLCPDINHSELYFALKDKSILFPLQAISGISDKTAIAIIQERREQGPYKDIFDFILRMSRYKVTTNQLMNLIDAGALSSLDESRASLRNNLASALTFASFISNPDGTMVLDPNMFAKPVYNKVEDDLSDNLSRELKVLGMMVSGSPLDIYRKQLDKLHVKKLSDIPNSSGDIKLAVIIKNTKKAKTKNGDPMVWLSVYDDSSESEFALFSNVLANISPDVLKKNQVVILEGYYRSQKNDFSISNIYKLEGEKDE